MASSPDSNNSLQASSSSSSLDGSEANNPMSAASTSASESDPRRPSKSKKKHDGTTSTCSSSARKRRKLLTDHKRKERNAREQERSNKISDQFAELRGLLVEAGIVVPKGTKGSVLSVVVEYVRVLQAAENRTDAECQRLQQQIYSLRGGAQGPVAAKAVKMVANGNGVPSLMVSSHHDPTHDESEDDGALFSPVVTRRMDQGRYQSAFEHCSTPMGIASLGGSFLDCNRSFCQLTDYSKDQVSALSIFNLTEKEQLPYAFEQLSGLLTADTVAGGPIVLQGVASHLGLQIRLLDRGLPASDSTSSDTNDQPQNDCRTKILLVTLVQTSSDDDCDAVGPMSARAVCLPSGQPISIVSSTCMEKSEDVFGGDSAPFYSIA